MPVRIGVQPPAQFILTRLTAVDSDYVGSMFRGYSEELRTAGFKPPCRQTFHNYIWVLATLGAVVFDRAEVAEDWRGGEPEPVEGGYVPGCGMPAPRHYYRIEDPESPAWVNPYAAYRASRGLPTPVPTPRPPRVRVAPPAIALQPSAAEQLAGKWREARRNSVRLENDLLALEENGWEIAEPQDLIEEYRSLERSDFDSAEEFAEARTEAWEAIIDAIEELEPPEEEAEEEEEEPERPPGRIEPVPPPDVRRGRPTIGDEFTARGVELRAEVETLLQDSSPANIRRVERLMQQYLVDLQDRLTGDPAEGIARVRGENRRIIQGLQDRALRATGLNDPRILAARLPNVFGMLRRAASTPDPAQDIFVEFTPGSGALEFEGSRFRLVRRGREYGIAANYEELVRILLDCCPTSTAE